MVLKEEEDNVSTLLLIPPSIEDEISKREVLSQLMDSMSLSSANRETGSDNINKENKESEK